jgi:carbamoyl-phosphate synthase large subunit
MAAIDTKSFGLFRQNRIGQHGARFKIFKIKTLHDTSKKGTCFGRFLRASKYDEFIISIAEKLNPDGPVNFQFRIFNEKPVIFEINGRFSGTTPLRHFYGYNEVEALLNYYLFDKEIKKPELRNGVVMRTWSDLFVDEKDLSDLKEDKKLENITPEYFNFSLNQ